MFPFRRAARHRPAVQRNHREELRLHADLARSQASLQARVNLRQVR